MIGPATEMLGRDKGTFPSSMTEGNKSGAAFEKAKNGLACF